MGLMALEHSKTAYRADFAFYGTLVAGLGGLIAWRSPQGLRWELTAVVLAGFALWTLIEYALHRFVLHGLEPFRSWHAEHHDRPTALICSPTAFSASLVAVLVFLPALALAGPWFACAITLGVLAGYLMYAVAHHATHHWRADNEWSRRRKRWHAMHHHAKGPGCFGVTSSFWDSVFGTGKAQTRVAVNPAGEASASH